MAIMVSTDLKWYFSGGAAKDNANGIQGGPISSVAITQQDINTTPLVKNTFFDDVSHADRLAGKKQYRCYYIKNDHATETATSVKLYRDIVQQSPASYAIGYSGNAPNVQEQQTTQTSTPVYQVPLTSSHAVLDSSHDAQGIIVTGSDCQMYNVDLTKYEFYLRVEGNPTGDMYLRHRTEADQNLENDPPLHTVATIPLSGITTDATPVLYSYTDASPRKLAVGERISLEYFGGSSSDYVEIYRNSSAPYAGASECYNDGSSWHNVSNYDIAGNIYTGSTSGDTTAPTGVTFGNPNSLETAISLPDLTHGSWVGIWVERDIPLNCAAKTNDVIQLAVVFDSPDA